MTLGSEFASDHLVLSFDAEIIILNRFVHRLKAFVSNQMNDSVRAVFYPIGCRCLSEESF